MPYLDYNLGLAYSIDWYGSKEHPYYQLTIYKFNEIGGWSLVGTKESGVEGYTSREFAEADVQKWFAMYKEGTQAQWAPTLGPAPEPAPTPGPLPPAPAPTPIDNQPYESGLAGGTLGGLGGLGKLGGTGFTGDYMTQPGVQAIQAGLAGQKLIGSSQINIESQPTTLKLKNPVDATYLTGAVKELNVDSLMLADGRHVPIIPVCLFDPTTNPIVPGVATHTSFYNNVLGIYELERTPTVFKYANVFNVGSTALWTAPAGKRWRLLRLQVVLISGTTAAATCVMTLLDVAAATGVGIQINNAALAACTASNIILDIDFKGGLLAAAVNTALNVNLSSALGVHGLSVQAWGTEE